jgi:hypothetical protein
MSNTDDEDDEMRAEYDLTNAVRTSKYAELYAQGTNVVLLEPDLIAAFPDSKSVDDALRVILEASRRVRKAS